MSSLPIPSVNSTKIVLITGINGYIASHIGLLFLKSGYTVHGTSRSQSSAHRLLDPDPDSPGPFHPYAAQYQHLIVPDITAPGAFDEAVRGVYAIIHVASPVDFSFKTVDEFFVPAVQGNLSILNSALKHAGPQLESFVLTSSIAAVSDRWKQPPGHAYTEEDWNTSGEGIARNPETFSGPIAYGASKAASEKAMWDWHSTHKPSFVCTAINPGVVTGPPILLPDSPEKLNLTLLPIWKIYAGECEDSNTRLPPQIGGASYIDVRNVAELHFWAATHPEIAGGERYLATNGKAPPQAIADILRKRFPEREILVGSPGEGYVEGTYWYDENALEGTAVARKAYLALGRDVGYTGFIGFEKSVLDSVSSFERMWPGRARNFKR
jgi:nucleoside-diphosphate-sugar epimerase